MSLSVEYLSFGFFKNKIGRVVVKLGVSVCTIGGALTELTWVVQNLLFFFARGVSM